jgi:hypothetical protein
VQGFKKPFRIEGLEQIPEGTERADAKLVLHITGYTENKKREQTSKSIGLDFGIKDNIVDNEGNIYNRAFH